MSPFYFLLWQIKLTHFRNKHKNGSKFISFCPENKLKIGSGHKHCVCVCLWELKHTRICRTYKRYENVHFIKEMYKHLIKEIQTIVSQNTSLSYHLHTYIDLCTLNNVLSKV